MESRPFVVAQNALVGGFAPRELETETDGLCHIPEQVAEISFVSHGTCETDIAIDRIIDPVADVAVQARHPEVKNFQSAGGGSDTFQRVNVDRLQDTTAVAAESLAHVSFARDARELIDLPAEVGTNSPNICNDAIARSGRPAAHLPHNSGEAKFKRPQLVGSYSAEPNGKT